MTSDQLTRFRAKIDERGPDECWPWTASTAKGYGQIKIDGRNRKAHQLAWEVARGRTMPAGRAVCHRCDNPLCCNPKHLWLGTSAKNTADKVAKGRQARGPAHRALVKERSFRGEACPAARLTEASVLAIRAALVSPAPPSIAALAELHGVTRPAIRNIRDRKSWTHLP